MLNHGLHMKKKHVATIALGIFVLTGSFTMAQAADTPRTTWIKAKCAVCHGEDGAGNTRQGKETHAPDLRRPETQKLTDAELRALIEKGHAHMPSFKTALTNEQVTALVYYIRSLAPKK